MYDSRNQRYEPCLPRILFSFRCLRKWIVAVRYNDMRNDLADAFDHRKIHVDRWDLEEGCSRFRVADKSSPRIRDSSLHDDDGRGEVIKSQLSFMNEEVSGRSKTALHLKPHRLRFAVALPGHSDPFPYVACGGNCDGNAMYSCVLIRDVQESSQKA